MECEESEANLPLQLMLHLQVAESAIALELCKRS